jgi:hypothetical protein
MARHWMLGTLYTTKADGSVARIIANDPLTGRQIEINPKTKKVVGGHPLNDLTIDGFRPVTMKLPNGPP